MSETETNGTSAVLTAPCPACGEPNEIELDAEDLANGVQMFIDCDDCGEDICIEVGVVEIRSHPTTPPTSAGSEREGAAG